jgi:hypothetical protein
MSKLLWLDDYRNPFEDRENKLPKIDFKELYWVKSFYEFENWINKYGLPDIISFDHDLADSHYTPNHLWDNYEESKKWQEAQTHEEKTGYDAAKWLCEYCHTNKKSLPICYVHSANPVGADNIKHYINNYLKHNDNTNSNRIKFKI